MKTKPPRLPASIPAAACARAHDALKPLLHILEAFNHRHKNQHRASHWWAELGILRRSLRALVPDALHRREAALLSRVRWMKNHVIARCYVAFTQLAADNQHAPLGLLLLAVLAQINTVALDLLPDSEPSQEREPKNALLTSSAAPQAKAEKHSVAVDRGTVVSRDDISATRPQKPTQALTRLASPPQKVEKLKSKKKSTKKRGDEFASLFGNLG
jgi:ribonuclease MRP protein subunit RMP1